MNYKVITTLLMSMATVQAFAMDITISAPPGGTSGRTAVTMLEALKDNNIGGEVKYNPNCAVVKNDIENNNAKMVYLNSSQGLVDPVCSVNIDGKKIKVIDELYYYTNALCYRKDKQGLGWENFSNNKVKKNIAASIVTTPIIKNIIDKMKLNESSNIVTVGSSGKTREVILGNEFEYAVVDADWVSKNTDKVDCLFIGTEKDATLDSKTYKSLPVLLKEKYGVTNAPPMQDVLVVLGVNLTDEEEKSIRKELELIRSNQKWKDFVNQFGKDEVSIKDNKFKIITDSLKVN
jgi:hypothetical protein